MKASNWAEEAANRFREKQAADEQRHKDAIAEQHLIKEYGARLWTELRESVSERCSSFNRAVGQEVLIWEVVQNTIFEIRKKDSRSALAGEFATNKIKIKGTISPQTPTISRDFEILLIASAGKVGIVGTGGKLHEPNELAEDLLSEFLDK